MAQPPSDLRDLFWRRLSACDGMNPSWFMPEATHEQKQKAFGTCRFCKVRDSCLDYGVRTRQTGIYGGVLLDEGWNRASLTQEAVRARLFSEEAIIRVEKRLKLR